MPVYIIMTLVSCGAAYMAQRSLKGDTISIGKVSVDKRILYFIAACIPLVLVSGLRWDTGVDHLNYYYVFTNVNFGLETHVEIGFKLLCKLVWLFTKDMAWLFMLCTLITMAFTFVAIWRNSSNLFISVFLFIAMGYFYYSMNSIRHFMALALYLFAYRFLRERKLLWYVGVILLAAMFHKIALIALPLYFLLNIKYKRYWYGIFAVVLLLVNYFHRPILDLVYRYIFEFYKDIEGQHVGMSIVNVGIMLALTILCMLYEKKLLERSSQNIILINAAFLGVIFFTLCGWIPEYTRIGQYLTMLALFLVPEILACEERPKINQIYTIGLVVGFSAFMIVMLINSRVDTIQLIPYSSVFSRDSYWI